MHHIHTYMLVQVLTLWIRIHFKCLYKENVHSSLVSISWQKNGYSSLGAILKDLKSHTIWEILIVEQIEYHPLFGRARTFLCQPHTSLESVASIETTLINYTITITLCSRNSIVINEYRKANILQLSHEFYNITMYQCYNKNINVLLSENSPYSMP